jgi:hypothetical protein
MPACLQLVHYTGYASQHVGASLVRNAVQLPLPAKQQLGLAGLVCISVPATSSPEQHFAAQPDGSCIHQGKPGSKGSGGIRGVFCLVLRCVAVRSRWLPYTEMRMPTPTHPGRGIHLGHPGSGQHGSRHRGGLQLSVVLLASLCGGDEPAAAPADTHTLLIPGLLGQQGGGFRCPFSLRLCLHAIHESQVHLSLSEGAFRAPKLRRNDT